MNNFLQKLTPGRMLVVILVLGLLGIAALIVADQSKARLTIISEADATILVAETGENLEEIGTGRATFKTASRERVYVLAQSGDRATQMVVELDAWERREVSLELTDLLSGEVVVEGPLANAHLEPNFAYGTDPLSQEVVYVPRGEQQLSDVNYSGLSPVSDIVWVDRMNFVADAFGQGTVYFVKGSPVLLDNDFETEGERAVFYQDFATNSPRDRILLLQEDKLFRTDGLGDILPRFLSEVPTDDQSSMFSVGSRAVIATPKFENAIVDLGEEGQAEFALVSYDMLIVNYQGEVLASFAFDTTTTIEAIVPGQGDDIVILTGQDILTYNQAGELEQSLPLFVELAQDVVVINGSPYVLNDEGLWRYDTAGQTLHRVSAFADEERYAQRSLDVLNGRLIYSVSLIEQENNLTPIEIDFTGLSENAPPNGSVYGIPLSQLQ